MSVIFYRVLIFFSKIFVYLCIIMNQNKNKSRRVGGLLLEVLMLAFIFAYSWTDAKAIDHHHIGELTISAAPVEQIVFRDSDSSPESLIPVSSKALAYDSEVSNSTIDLPSMEVFTSKAFLIAPSLYNTFYTVTTIGAP